MEFAVAVVGVPGPIINGLLVELRKRFSENYVFRGAGVAVRAPRLTLYDQKAVDVAVRMTADAAFTNRDRPPRGFCRNAQGSCALHREKGTCGKTEQHTCALDSPGHVVVLFQEGEGEGMLRAALHHSAYLVRLPRAVYNNLQATKSAAFEGLKAVRQNIGSVRRLLETSMSPLLLPPDNFSNASLNRVLEGMAGDREEVEKLRRATYSRENKAYIGRGQMLFSPATVSGRHGTADLKSDALALTRAYRLGCRYSNDWHYDVSLKAGGSFSGKTAFFCRENGKVYPKKTYINLTVDDCVK